MYELCVLWVLGSIFCSWFDGNVYGSVITMFKSNDYYYWIFAAVAAVGFLQL